ncbi:zinc-binding dehydrogenase [Halobellus salinisoli]|uniref:zinc-binding dehydrogenase n=1 Tax=Halobellus salinisoli TaxID=3108500 RepID=UPI0030097D74
MKSTAAVLMGPLESGDFATERPVRTAEIDVEAPTGTEVLIEIGAASLCHSDISMSRGHHDKQYPFVMGHEGAGYVQAVGDDVTTVEVGQQVVLGRMSCGRCEYCRIGRSNLCERRVQARKAGTLRTGARRFRLDGSPIYHCHGVSSFSEYTIVTEEVAIPVTDEIPIRHASLLGCGVFTGAGAVMNTADIEPGADIAIFGCGGVGLSAIQAADVRGAGRVIAVDLVDEKLDLAADLGATHTVNSGVADPVEQIRDIVDDGVDYAFEIVGNVGVAEQAIESLAPLGTAVLVGAPPRGTKETELNYFDVVLGERSIVGSFNGSYDLPTAIPKLAEMVARGRFDLDPLISGERTLDEVNEALSELDSGSGIRQLIIP